MAMNLTDPGSNMHSEEQQNPEQVAKFNITFRLYASTMKRKAYAILKMKDGQKMLFSGHL